MILRALLVLLASVSIAAAMPSNYPQLDDRKVDTLTLERGNFDDDEEPEIIMENRWLRLVVEPEHGGTISSVYYKPHALEFTRKSTAGDWGGLFRNVIDGTPAKRDWYGATFNVEVVTDTDLIKAVRLSAAGKTGAYTGVTLTKTYTLRADSSRIACEYVIENDPISVKPLPFAMRMHNGIGVAGADGHLFWPVEQGMFRQDLPGGHYIWEPNPTRGFCGYVTDDGAGMALHMEYRLLDKFYYWSNHGQLPVTTLEWYMNELPVPAGGSVSTTIYVMPFNEVPQPTGVTDAIVGSLGAASEASEPGAVPVDVSLTSSVGGSRELKLEARLLPDGEFVEVDSRAVTFEPDKHLQYQVQANIAEAGTHHLKLTVLDEGRPVGRLDAPLIVGRAHVPYRQEALEKRYAPLAEEQIPQDFDYTSLAVETPHVKWAKPYAGGRGKFFMLQDGYHQREAVELAQRFDFEPSSSFLTGNLDWATYALGDYITRISEQDLLKQMQEKFIEHKDADVILLSGPVWQWFTPWMKGELIERVKNGAGLVWIDPSECWGELAEVLPVTPVENPSRPRMSWTNSDTHYIPRGLPLAALPQATMEQFEAKGDVVARAGDRPLVVTGTFGEGRVVVLGYDTRITQWSGHRITPAIADDHTFAAHEYHLGLVGRSMIWAAKKEPSAAMRTSLDGDKLTVTVEGLAEPATLGVTWRDRFSDIVQSHEASLGNGATTIDVPVLPNGTNFADLILHRGGERIEFAAVAIPVERDLRIASLEADANAFTFDEPIAVTAKVEGDATRRFRVIDTRGRLLAEDVVTSDTYTAGPFAQPTLRLMVHLDLLDAGGRVIATSRCPVDYRQIPPADDLIVTYGWHAAAQHGMPAYLYEPYFDVYKTIGASGWHQRPGTNRPAEIEAARAANLPATMTDGPMSWGKTPLSKSVAAKYDQTHDKFVLVRSGWCLSDPELGAYVDGRIAERAALPFAEWGAFEISNGDENAYTTKTYDLCFHEHCLTGMRDWLNTRYDSLDALNAEWATQFATWADVVPMTRGEIVNHPSWAPWLDHRQYGEYNFARAFRYTRDAVDKHMPGVRTSTKGSGITESLHGWDWWQLRDSFTSLSAYGGQQTIQQRSFMDDVPMTKWIGYGKRNADSIRHGAWHEMLHGLVRGFTVFSGRNNVNPDFTIPSTGKALNVVFQELNKGVARQFFLGEPDVDPIVFHYSPRSMWTSVLYRTFDQRLAGLEGMSSLVNEAGLQYAYVAYEQLETDSAALEHDRVLFLPGSTALSDGEATAIRAFVERGGVVVADFMPGLLTGHGAKRDAAALDDLFGIKQTGELVRGSGAFDGEGEAGGITLQKLHTPINLASVVELNGGEALGKWRIESRSGPAMIVNTFGKGAAVYLGSDMLAAYNSAKQVRQLPRGKAVIEPLTALLASIQSRAGAQPAVTVVTADGNRASAAVFRFKARGMNMVGVIGDRVVGGEPVEAVVNLPRQAPTYHLLASEPVSDAPIDHAPITLGPLDVRVFVQLDVAPTRLEVKATRTGRRINLSAQLLGDGDLADHVLRIETTDPNGEPFEPLTDNVTTDAGAYEGQVDLAINDPKGGYTITVRDVITGLSTDVTLAYQ